MCLLRKDVLEIEDLHINDKLEACNALIPASLAAFVSERPPR